MEKKFCLSVLTFCVIVSQGINSSEVNIRDSLNFHVRNKRVINFKRGEDRGIKLLHFPYIVSIQKDGRSDCAGSILSSNVIISAAHCFLEITASYEILSNSAYINHGTPHNVVRKIRHLHYNRTNHYNDIILIVISPPIDFHKSNNEKIELYNGPIAPNTKATFCGWGCTGVTREGKNIYPNELRSMTVPIISLDACKESYRHRKRVMITERNICTHESSGKMCSSYGDSGGPLVINNKLVGVMSLSENDHFGNKPDIFTNACHSVYRDWIDRTIQQYAVV